MTAADQIVRSAKKVLAMEGRPHMTTFAPILMSFSFRVVIDPSLIVSGSPGFAGSCRDYKRMKLKANRVGGERATAMST
jgi:hypothetical protein